VKHWPILIIFAVPVRNCKKMAVQTTLVLLTSP